MALENENGGGGIPATMLVGPATFGNNAMPYYPMPMMMGGGNNGGGMSNGWGDGAWIILLIIVLLAAGGGWGNNNAGGGFGGGAPIVINDGNNGGYVQRGFDQAAIMSGVGAIQSGISALSTQLCGCCCDMQNTVNQGFSNVQQALCSGFAGVNATVNNAQNALTQQMYTNQIADMERSYAAQTATTQGFTNVNSGIADVRYTIATEECATRNNSTQNTRDIIDAQTRGTQLILDKLCALEIDNYKRENDNLRTQLTAANFAASQTAQTAQIQRGQVAEVDALYQRLRDCPVPSMPVYGMQPIFTCPGNNNNGCGCGCGGNNF